MKCHCKVHTFNDTASMEKVKCIESRSDWHFVFIWGVFFMGFHPLSCSGPWEWPVMTLGSFPWRNTSRDTSKPNTKFPRFYSMLSHCLWCPPPPPKKKKKKEGHLSYKGNALVTNTGSFAWVTTVICHTKEMPFFQRQAHYLTETSLSYVI